MGAPFNTLRADLRGDKLLDKVDDLLVFCWDRIIEPTAVVFGEITDWSTDDF